MKAIIGVDLGGTLVRAARFDDKLNMLARAEQPTRANEGQDAVLSRLYETIQQVFPENPDDLSGIGVAIPGPLDSNAGLIIKTPNLPFENIPIVKLIQDAAGGPVYIGNDADLAGLGEHKRGAGRGSEHMIFMTISTGVGGGIIIDGKPYTGSGLGGEIGHMIVDPHGPICGCGQQGHLEAISSGTAIARAAVEYYQDGKESILWQMVEDDVDKITARTVGNAAQQGDPLALDIITQAGRGLGIAIASLMSLLNPDVIVMGGGVTNTGDLLFSPMQEAIKEYAFHPRYYEPVSIVLAELGEDMGLYGAGALVQAHY